MNRLLVVMVAMVSLVGMAACATYEAKPLPYRAPASMAHSVQVSGATVAAQVYHDPEQARQIFGFDVREAGILPVQVSFENGPHPLLIEPTQTFLEDAGGNLWPILEERFAYDRVGRYAQTNEIFKEGAYNAVLGAAAGAIIGAAIGIATGGRVPEAAGVGAAIGGATGAVTGGVKGATDPNPVYRVMEDFKAKSLQNKNIPPNGLSFGVIFFPGEAGAPAFLRLKLVQSETGVSFNLKLPL